jgi:ribosomal protein S3
MFTTKIDIAIVQTGPLATAAGIRVQVSGRIHADARSRHAMPIAATAVMDVPRPVHDLSPTTT